MSLPLVTCRSSLRDSKFFKQIKKLSENSLFRGSFVMFAGAMTANFFNYLFNLAMGRILGPVDYGILAALVSLLVILSVPSTTLTTMVIKFTSEFKARGEYQNLALLLRKLSLVFLGGGLFTAAFFALFSQPLSQFLKIPSPLPVIILGSLFLIVFPQTINNGILQGLQRFTFYSANTVFAGIIKLTLGVGLVLLGFSVEGALLGIFASMFIPYLLTFVPLRFLLYEKVREIRLAWGRFLRFGLPTLLTTLGLTLLISFDIVLVKRFFDPYEAGIYSALSLTSRVIFFATSSMIPVMFSLISERHTARKRYEHLLGYTLLLVGGLSFSLTVFYFAFPRFVIHFFFGPKYLGAAPFLGFFAIFISLYSFCNVFASFYLSIRRTTVATLALPASLLQAILISLFHQNFFQVVAVSAGTTALLLSILVVYYFKKCADN